MSPSATREAVVHSACKCGPLVRPLSVVVLTDGAGVDRVVLPAMALLGGYARGTFSNDSSGDKTVGFALVGNSKCCAISL